MTRFSLTALAAAACLAGCSSFDPLFAGDKVDYRTQSKQTPGLEVPPDLTQLQRTAPLGQGASISAAELASRPAAAPAAAAPSLASVAVNQVPGAEIVRVGGLRIIRSNQSPEQLWPLVRGFWVDLGFDLPKDQADVGVLETDWKENRAKLPKDFIRRTIGTVLDGLYSTGERDMFRTRLERVGNHTEITLTHRGMHEIYVSNQRDQTTWTARPADPELEAEMLSRLLLRLGGKTTVANSSQAAAAAVATPTVAAPQAAAPMGEVPDQLVIAEDFERAWRRVGQSLDRHGFTVEDRDRRAGVFFLRWADPKRAGKEEPNWFERLFSKDQGPVMGRYRVVVKSEANAANPRSVVNVQDEKGQQLTDEAAKRILALLQQDLR
ncbi:outer membrane protein assembly factor BamC [Inhella sp.]|uniref:outer membrane protein assembly factor BamC n=1 Tax=Inhella sp. TaxID=1921806 RepID=UPI0035B03064